MKFYLFSQNNSGGKYKGPHFVMIKSNDLEDAIYYAKKYGGVYFDGVENGADCSCCGDRWSIPYSTENVSSVEEFIERIKRYYYLKEFSVLYYSPEIKSPVTYLVEK